ncbi:uncharacterized protein MEPE_00538 [Melanopsichium pennsylvanicum]|uniref:RNA polymerase II-associated protein 1 C-terminal domain-containing protein n=2 Tax=Melanopsichium pennsylvanicum TaxID=63383 RepID=A0AAJ4XIM4_9BASI|nr:conserved hypothetical protein [Melanopsichium pennsylvanicum 4]SNX81833.1 uncharacterized protein MEPE_00538 [Melanopsichium pennsylvanicum]
MASQEERQMRKQQIRPRFVDLAEFDDDMPDTSRRAALDSFSDWPPAASVVRKKAPAITSSKRSESLTSQAAVEAPRKPTVDEVEEDHITAPKQPLLGEKAGQIRLKAQSHPRTVRFTPDTASASDGNQDAQASPKVQLDLSGSIIGTIQERPAGDKRTRPGSSSKPKPSGSRFVVRRRMDEDLQKHEEQRQQRLQAESIPQGQQPGTGFPEVHHRDWIASILPPTSGKTKQVHYSEDMDTVEAPQRDALATRTALGIPSEAVHASKVGSSADDDEWLDDDGKPMSAFRKSRLLRKGLRPPSVRRKTDIAAADERRVPDFKSDPTRDPGGGADIDAITAVLSDVARENDQKLRQMSAAEVSEEIRSLENLFGKDVLDALRNRKSSTTDAAGTSSSILQSTPKQGSSATELTSMAEEGGPLAIKRQYFPAEPEGPNPSLEWMMPQPSYKTASTELRFGFSGEVIERGVQTDQTYLSGLHHHGEDQEAPGYTISELVHLTRSTVAAQRQLALNVLSRICEQNPTFSAASENKSGSEAASRALNEHGLLLRARVISMSRWFLGDRHFTVRAAALRCLTSAIRSLPAGVSVPLGAEQEIDFYRSRGSGKADVEDRDGGAEASEVEVDIQKDWAKVMLESNILSVFLHKTESIITSAWEAELALELLLRIASCSASHASSLFETDTARLCDFVVHLGLKMSWPPVTDDEIIPGTAKGRQSLLPSVTAVRLLHQGILSDRKIAESIVISGIIEHLFRFVVTPPWKVEDGWVSEDEDGDAVVIVAYQIFDEVLQLFASLASYGFFASLVSRTWAFWQESNTWALKQLANGLVAKASASTRVWLHEARSTAAQRIFEILGAWTHCAFDPHELLNHHDITWTQVRDWIEPVKDASQTITASGVTTRASTATPAIGALCSYIDAWLRCAVAKEPKLLPKYLDSCRIFLTRCYKPIQQHFLEVLRLFSSAPSQTIALDEAELACGACHRYLDLSKTFARAEQIASTQADIETAGASGDSKAMLGEGLALIACGPLWAALDSLESKSSGRQVFQRSFSNFVAAAVAARTEHPDHALELAAITRLDKRHDSRVAEAVMQVTRSLAGIASADTLRPFLLESIIRSNRLPAEDKSISLEHRDTTPLSKVSSLFKSIRKVEAKTSAKTVKNDQEEDEEDDKEDEDVDPMTGSKLWKCPASGLLLRPDWPLLALDDLLHSANTAVFNRPDNLEPHWKPSELEMVRASLALAVAVFKALLERSKQCTVESSDETGIAEVGAMLCSLPSPEQILLGVMKVFLLEKDQPDTFTGKNSSGTSQERQTGMLTGRDLFRDPTISSDIAALLDIADELVDLRQCHRKSFNMSTTTLDEWTRSTYGGGMSFYQFFTDLVGLWDSVSFGDANFARVVMTVANAGCSGGVLEGEHGIAVDFRRLVWNDYSESLRSIPATKAASWLFSWTDEDVDMLEHYCRYLARAAEVTTARQSIAWQIASHHIGSNLRSLGSDVQEANKETQTKRIESILKSFVAAKGGDLVSELLESSNSATSDGDLKQLFTRLGLSETQN